MRLFSVNQNKYLPFKKIAIDEGNVLIDDKPLPSKNIGEESLQFKVFPEGSPVEFRWTEGRSIARFFVAGALVGVALLISSPATEAAIDLPSSSVVNCDCNCDCHCDCNCNCNCDCDCNSG